MKYYEKDVLTEDDLEEVQQWFEESETGDPEFPSDALSDNDPDLSEENATENETDLSDEAVSADVPEDTVSALETAEPAENE